MLNLRLGTVVGVDPLEVEIERARRRAWADVQIVGECLVGDEVIVNTEALDLRLGSGGFDIVHANLTRGLTELAPADSHVIKLNYSSLQHSVDPVERPVGDTAPDLASETPVLVIGLHGQLAPAVWAASRRSPWLRIGYVQTSGGALPGSFSRDVAGLRADGALCGHITAGPTYGGEHEAISTVGGLDAAASALGWDVAIAGPGPGILGSATRLGHGAMAGLDSAHAALALGMPILVAPRMSASDPRPRHRGLSHHTRTVLDLLLAPVEVPIPRLDLDLDTEVRDAIGDRHRVTVHEADLDGYRASGLPTRTMGRTIDEDPLFFASALAAGTALGERANEVA